MAKEVLHARTNAYAARPVDAPSFARLTRPGITFPRLLN
jgi:hypothetical protein